jgi:hypothetical protein
MKIYRSLVVDVLATVAATENAGKNPGGYQPSRMYEIAIDTLFDKL